MRDGKHEAAQAAVAQDMKSLLQVAIDRGDWSNANLLAPYQDPLHSEAFGGGETEMRNVVSYQKGLRELKAKVGIEQDTTPADEDKPAWKGQSKGAAAAAAAKAKAAARKGADVDAT